MNLRSTHLDFAELEVYKEYNLIVVPGSSQNASIVGVSYP